MTAHEERLVVELKALVKQEVALRMDTGKTDPGIAHTLEEAYLLRFLRARSHKVSVALKLFMVWGGRRRWKLDLWLDLWLESAWFQNFNLLKIRLLSF